MLCVRTGFEITGVPEANDEFDETIEEVFPPAAAAANAFFRSAYAFNISSGDMTLAATGVCIGMEGMTGEAVAALAAAAEVAANGAEPDREDVCDESALGCAGSGGLGVDA